MNPSFDPAVAANPVPDGRRALWRVDRRATHGARTHGVPTDGARTTRTLPATRPAHAAVLRALLVAGCLAAIAFAAWLGEPAAVVQADPERAFLLRGMAALKGAIVLAALAVMLWRFGRPIAGRFAVPYLLASWLAAGSAMLVWRLSFIAHAAVLFHLAEITVLLVAWAEHRQAVLRG